MKKAYKKVVVVIFVLITCALLMLSGCHDPLPRLSLSQQPHCRLSIQALLSEAKSGDSVQLPAGLFLEDISVPPGVSLRGNDARKTTIAGSVTLSSTATQRVSLSAVSLIHTGGRGSSLVQCTGQNVEIRHCLLVSEGGFATVNATGAEELTLCNNIIIGPRGDYAIFGRHGGHINIINNTIIVQGFGVGLMDDSSATIRNCLFCGNRKPALVRTSADYQISYSNICLGGPSFYYEHDLIDGNIILRDPSNHPEDPTPSNLTNKDEPKYDSLGLTFVSHKYSKSKDIDHHIRTQPTLARHSGCPAEEYNNPDGSRNTLGAFGGPLGNW